MDRDAKRVFEGAGEIASLLVIEIPGDLRAAAVVIALQDRRGDDLAIEDDGHLATAVLAGHLVENAGALAVEFERNAVALLVEVGKRAGHMIARESGAALDENLLLLGGFLRGPVGFENEGGVHDLLAGFDALDVPLAHDGELELGDALELRLGFGCLFGVEPGDLDEDAVLALRGDDGFADAVLVHALADDLDGLVEEIRGDAGFRLRDEADQEGSATLEVQTEADFFRGRDELLDAERREDDCEHEAEPALAAGDISGEIPSEEDQDGETDGEGERWRHRGVAAGGGGGIRRPRTRRISQRWRRRRGRIPPSHCRRF